MRTWRFFLSARTHSLSRKLGETFAVFVEPLQRYSRPFAAAISAAGNEEKRNGDQAIRSKDSRARRSKTVDVPSGRTGSRGATEGRLPNWLVKWQDEFPRSASAASDARRQSWRSGHRIFRIAVERVFDSQAARLVALSGSAVLGLGTVEALILCKELPLVESWEATVFAARYAVEQLLPSCVWQTADANLVASSLGIDPAEVLRQLDPAIRPEDARAILRLQALAACRSIVAGFMLIAQLVRAVHISASAAMAYEERIRSGTEPPLGGVSQRVFRLSGRGSCVAEVSLHRYGEHIFPVFEDPGAVVHLVRMYSQNGRVPVFWCVNPRFYGYRFSWSRLPVDAGVFLRSSTGKCILYLEADATNSDDPLALGIDESLDLTIDDASQGFRMLEASFRAVDVPPFRTMKVLLANSLEESQSGGGYSYTLRHRIRYAKEMDVLIDSRAPVISELLKWCDRVTGKDGEILVQTSSRRYFLSLQLLLRRYGYQVFDPLDWRTLHSSREEPVEVEKDANENVKSDGSIIDSKGGNDDGNIASKALHSLLRVLLDDKGLSSDSEVNIIKDEHICKRMSLVELSKMPRLVYYKSTAETVNAVQALVNAGEVDVASCCALLDREEGVRLLEEFLLQRKPGLMERRIQEKRRRDLEAELASVEYKEVSLSAKNEAMPIKMSKRKRHLQQELDAMKDKASSPSASANGSGLHIVCSSIIYDDLFRQVRQWARMGFPSQEIQKELDLRYQDIIKHSGEVSSKVSAIEELREGTDSQDDDNARSMTAAANAVSEDATKGTEEGSVDLLLDDAIDRLPEDVMHAATTDIAVGEPYPGKDVDGSIFRASKEEETGDPGKCN